MTIRFLGGLLSDRTYELLIGYPWPAEDLLGNTMESFALTFTTVEIGAPTVVSVLPADHSTGVDPATAVRLTFNEPMNGPSVVSRVSVYRASLYPVDPGGPVSGSVSYDSVTRTAVFTPDAPLAAGRRFLVTLTAGALDETGVATEDVFSSEFWTR
jgi:type IV pilus assembly protein PilY1